MKRTCIAALYIILLALTACTPGSVSQAPASEEFSQEEALPIAPAEIPAEDRAAAITPANGERIREKKAENGDVVGWLTVPGTDIDSVIVQNPPNDNSFYTTHDFEGNPSKDGVYCADMRGDFTIPTRVGIPQNIALYGHNWDENPDGRLFAQLKRFKDPAFAKAHPYIFFSTEAEDMVWEVFAVYDITVNQPYIIPDLPWSALSEILDIAYDASIYDYGLRLTEPDKILTLSTCSFDVPGRSTLLPLDKIPDYRFVVMARLVSPEDVYKETAAFTLNDDILTPDAMPAIYSHHTDVIQYGGKLYDNLARSHADKIPVIGPADLIPVGEIVHTGVMRDLQDFDATKLPEGTPLYRLLGYDNLLAAKLGDEILVYGHEVK